jgi:ubiquinone/menaquinone biosynthesis C-methylase UbiE
MANQTETNKHDEKELAYLYDLYIVPMWREAFDRIVDEEIELPKEGKFLDAGCGTGGYSIELAVRGGAKVTVVGVDPNAERLALARGKAEIQMMNRVTFQQAPLDDLDFTVGEFDLVIGDLSLLPPDRTEGALDELIRVAKKGATIAVKLATHGSFGEFYSIYWEALYDLGLTEYSSQIEGLITQRLQISQAEELALDAGLQRVRSVTRIERFQFDDAKTFFESPLIETTFLDDWLAILPDPKTRQQALQQLTTVIDRERRQMNFDVSIKATLLIGQK